MATKNYSMYLYYNGSDIYPNNKAKFFGFYERSFELTYTGSDADKEELFKDYILELLYEQASDIYHFGEGGVDIDKSLEEYISIYYEPEYQSENYDRPTD